jgi:dihydrodipicolinate synthase/N-acetylneuraminate lyase
MAPDPMNDRYDTVRAEREALVAQLVPGGWPRLWCPLLTHYDAQGAIDLHRMRRQLDHLQGSVGGYLVPGSTGDGWQLGGDERQHLLEFAVDEAATRGTWLTPGVLSLRADDTAAQLDATMAWLCRRTGAQGLEALRRARVVAFTVCPPADAGQDQARIAEALDGWLSRGLPLALYQLPQVTGNEMTPETVQALARRHPNLLMLKDTSGADRVADAGLPDVFLVRGAEGGYARRLKAAGGAYDGLLLSTANALGPVLASMLQAVQDDRMAQAQDLADRLDAVVQTVFAAASPLTFGNAFTNANKALDHAFAHGPGARQAPAPRVHSGQTLPRELLETAQSALEQAGLMPTAG